MHDRRPNRVLAISLFLIGVVIVLWFWHQRERIEPIAPKVYLSKNGMGYALLDGRHDPDVGIDPPPRGGRVMVDRLAGIQVIGDWFVVGKTEAEEFFLMSLRKLGPDELEEDTVQRFASEAEWRAACRTAGIPDPTLRPPSDLLGRW